MIRVLNFLCVAVMGLSILALYHVSEQTRIARIQLQMVEQRVADAHVQKSILQTKWEQVAGPERIQALAESSLGMNDTATVQLSSLTLLPRRGDDDAPLGGAREASARIAAPAQPKLIKIVARAGY